MKNRKNTLFTIVMLFGVLLSMMVPITYVTAENDDELKVKEGDNYTSVIELLDHDKYFEAFGQTPNGYQGLNTKTTIEYIYDGDDFWKIEVEILRWKTRTDVKSSEATLKAPKEVDSYDPEGTDYIPINGKKFLDDWEDYIDDDPSMENYSVEGLTVVLEDEDKEIEQRWTYDADGLLEKQTIEFEGDEIMRTVIDVSLISFGYYFLGFMAIAIMCIIYLTMKKYRGGKI